jgi:DNA-binding transcriptional ArsR family regulator
MEVARAIADPVRREILTMLAGAPRSAGAIAAAFDVSRPAISRHLRVLREHGLVRDEVEGRQRVYRLDVTALAPLEGWLAALREAAGVPAAAATAPAPAPAPATGDPWGPRLDALETEVARTRRDRRSVRTDSSDSEERSA